MDVIASIVIPISVGFGVGILSGLLGIGGGAVVVAVFRLGFGLSPIMSTATSLFTVMITAVSGSVTHIKGKTCILSMGIVSGLGGALTSPLGVFLAAASPAWLIIVVTAGILAYSGYTMFRKAITMKKNSGPVDSSIPEQPKLTTRNLVISVIIGIIAGFCAGFAGVGGGFIFVPMMVTLLKAPMKLTSGTSMIAIMILSIPGVITQGVLGNVAWMAGLAIALGSLPGSVLGARWVRYVPERQLRFLFAGFLLVAAALLIVNEVVG